MGSGDRKRSIEYIPPSIGNDTSVVCPGRFGAVSMMTHAPVLANDAHKVVLAGGDVVAIEGDAILAVVLDAPDDLLAALRAGCHYVATFGQATEAGHVAVAEVLLE